MKMDIAAVHFTDTYILHEPMGYVDGANLYQFVESNPPGSVDPSGLVTALTNGKIYTSTADGGSGIWELKFQPGNIPGGKDDDQGVGITARYTPSNKKCNCSDVEVVQFVKISVDGKPIVGADVANYLDGRTWHDPKTGWGIDQSADSITSIYNRDSTGKTILEHNPKGISMPTTKPVQTQVIDTPADKKTAARVFTWDFIALAICLDGNDKGTVLDAARWNVTKFGVGSFGSSLLDDNGNPRITRTKTSSDDILNAISAWNQHKVDGNNVQPFPGSTFR